MTKQELIRLAKKEHLTKTLRLTMYALVQRGHYDDVECAMEDMMHLRPEKELMLKWLKDWQTHLNSRVIYDNLSILDLMAGKSKVEV